MRLRRGGKDFSVLAAPIENTDVTAGANVWNSETSFIRMSWMAMKISIANVARHIEPKNNTMTIFRPLKT